MKTWLWADPHLCHKGMTKFTLEDGSKARPWDDVDDMTNELIDNYNSLVSDNDRVYILGDLVFTNNALRMTAPRLKGRKVLVKGNHDTLKLSKYLPYFDDIRSIVVKKGFVLTHVPVHPACLSRWGVNIHGHLHTNKIEIEEFIGGSVAVYGTIPDPRYRCVSVEQTGYKPIELDQVLTEMGVKT